MTKSLRRVTNALTFVAESLVRSIRFVIMENACMTNVQRVGTNAHWIRCVSTIRKKDKDIGVLVSKSAVLETVI